MEEPPTPKPYCLQPTPKPTPPTANQYAGVAYITLAGLVDTMVPAAGPWALVGQSASYLIKLAPHLRWALPSSQQSKLAAKANRPSHGTRYPDITASKPWAGIEPAPSHQAGLAGRGELPAPGFLLFEANPGVGTIPALVAVEVPALGPKSYAQALVGLAGPRKAIFSCPVNPDQAHPPLSNLGSPIGDPFFNQVLWAQESLSNQSKNCDLIGKTPKTPEAKPAKINGQPSQDGPSKSQTTVHENPKNNHEAANQTAEPEMPSLATQIASEEYPEAPACDSVLSSLPNKVVMNFWFTNLFPYLFLILFHLHTPKRQHPSIGIDSQTPVDKPKAFNYYCPPNAPFGPVHFTEYPVNPDHKPWTLEDLQWYTRPNAPKEPYQIV
ncbi:hypothetical protein DSO57_1035278 [Entomophthora muscae]|uniref:Uncharacterized protein n=1 Tax=Entomophthora muscae TaxID=34485 RepID=A0ACC2RED6_9FUNG|nr:hypothetical protein DSO57_1035278 [Entomophthora muscae]